MAESVLNIRQNNSAKRSINLSQNGRDASMRTARPNVRTEKRVASTSEITTYKNVGSGALLLLFAARCNRVKADLKDLAANGVSTMNKLSLEG